MIFQTFAIQPHNIGITSPDNTRGDREFWGHGPRFVAHASLMRRANKLFARLDASWTETDGDFTTFEGTTGDVEIFNLDADPRYNGWNISSVNGNPTFDFTISDPPVATLLSGYGMHALFPPGTSLVSRYDVVGDSYGGWFGGDDHPSVNVLFRPIEIRLENPNAAPPPPRSMSPMMVMRR